MASEALNTLIKVLTEFFGSFLFSIVLMYARETLINTTTDTKSQLMSYNIYLLYFTMMMAYVFAYRVTGAHFNAAISTLALVRLNGRIKWYEFLLYLPAQIFGMMAGICLNWWYLRTSSSLRLYYNTKTQDYWIAEGVGMEIAAGAIFALVWLTQTDKETAVSKNKLWQALAIGMTYASTIYWSISRTGGNNNPTYGLLQTFIGLWKTGYSIEMQYTWLYVVCPYVGAFLAWPFYEFIFRPAHKVPVGVADNQA